MSNNKPILTRPYFASEYNINDPDGGMTMLDKRFSGCNIMHFTVPMDLSVRGKVFVDGKQTDYILKEPAGYYMTFLGVFLRGYLVEYGQKTVIRVEGFKDIEGNEMEPTEFEVTAIEKVSPLPEYAEHEAVALQAAEEGIVLLKNDNFALPLKSDSVLNFFGKGLYEFRVTAAGAGRIHPRYTVCLREAILEHSGFTLNKELDEFYRACRDDSIPNETVIENAKNLSDTAFIVISRNSGENIDNAAGKGGYLLTDDEEALLEKVSQAFKKTVLILNVGYPIGLAFLDKYKVDAVVYNGYGGMLAGKALVKILDGRVNPSGKLPFTWGKALADIPADKNFYKYGGDNPFYDGSGAAWMDTVYEEGIYIGYRYFDTFGVKPAFPFGRGLSYTEFSVQAENFAYNHETGASFKISVKNTGSTPGKEVVQIYVSKPDGKLEKPAKELVEFEKTELLAAGQTQALTFTVPNKHLTSYDEVAAAYIMEAGEYRFYAGNSSAATKLIGTFTLKETVIVKQVKNRMQSVTAPQTLSKFAAETTYPMGRNSGIKEGVNAFEPKAERGEYVVRFPLSDKSVKRLTFADVQKDNTLLSAFVNQLEVEELVRLCVCTSESWKMENIGEAGRVFRLDGREMPVFVVADGNSGVNIKKRNIGMPSGVTMSASFNKELAEDIGRVIGEEAKENGISMILAPGMNIQRHPLNGRHPEYFSEDPYLSGTIAGTYTKGLESTGVCGCYKHCMANNCETVRNRNQSIMTERALREIYFKNFEIAMEIKMPVSIMMGYNGVNGKPTSTDPDLILGLFREECGFDGYAMTDWGTYSTVDTVDMANAGISWITPGSDDDTYTKPLNDAIMNGRITVERLKENVYYLLKALL